jgi:hypothetical protein
MSIHTCSYFCERHECIKAQRDELRQKLEQAEQIVPSDYSNSHQREWVGLTDEEVNVIIDKEIGFNSCWGPEEKFARAIEAKLKDKNT